MIVHGRPWIILKLKHVFKYLAVNVLNSDYKDVQIPAELW
jgi:hypothetical protein